MTKITINFFSEALLEYTEEPPNNIAINNANRVLEILGHLNLLPQVIVPEGSGGVVLCWFLPHVYIAIDCFNDNDILFWYRVKGFKCVNIINPSPQQYKRIKALLHHYGN